MSNTYLRNKWFRYDHHIIIKQFDLGIPIKYEAEGADRDICIYENEELDIVIIY